MQTRELTSPDSVAAALQILSWVLIGLAALWVVTAVIGVFYRRAYNLTSAESGRSKNITPDFLTVDHKKREAALGRGAAFDAELTAREMPASVATIDRVRLWSRFAAVSTAVLAIVTTIVGTLKSVDTIQEGVTHFSSWDRFAQLVSQNKAGAIIAIVVIGSNVIVFVKTLTKTGKQG